MKICKYCNKEIKNPTSNRQRYCDRLCKNRMYQPKRSEAQRQRNARLNKPGESKIQCLICSLWYIQVGSHIVQVHKMTAREYREMFDLERKRGLTKGSFRKLKAEQAIEFGGVENLKLGAKYRFKPNDPVAGRYKRSHITLERVSRLGRGVKE